MFKVVQGAPVIAKLVTNGDNKFIDSVFKRNTSIHIYTIHGYSWGLWANKHYLGTTNGSGWLVHWTISTYFCLWDSPWFALKPIEIGSQSRWTSWKITEHPKMSKLFAPFWTTHPPLSSERSGCLRNGRWRTSWWSEAVAPWLGIDWEVIPSSNDLRWVFHRWWNGWVMTFKMGIPFNLNGWWGGSPSHHPF